MPLSTSSSDPGRIAEGWFRTLAGSLLLTLVLLGGWEICWRTVGFTPSVEDDLGIWALKRREVEDREGPAVVLLGASRMQLDVDPLVLKAETGRQAVMLAIDGSSPLPVLADLAENSSFNGLVLCSLLPQWLADGGVDRGRSAKWVRKFHQQKWSFWIETRLSLLLQKHFVFRYPGLLPDELWGKLREREMPLPPYAPMRTDRYRPADYKKINVGGLRAARIRRQQQIVAAAEPLAEEEFAARIRMIETMVRQIGERGGRVVFLRLPSCDEIFELEEETWPRVRYWDRFAAGVSARTIHFADYPSLSGFDCPDGSHLDFSRATKFTRSLAEILALQEEQL